MGQTLNHGVYLPAEGERNCYSGLASNWNLLDTAIGDIAGKASATHTHGNITNDGKVGTTANLPLITGTGGAITAGVFGTSANTFCEGNDSRLSDARTPVAHTHGKADITDLFNSANTWSGENKYTSGFILSNISWSGVTPPSSAKPTVIEFKNSDTRQGRYINRISSTSSETWIETIRNVDANTSYNHTVILKVDNSGNKSVHPSSNNDIDLGTSTNKWKTLNGINPGALSLPDYAKAANIDTTNWNTTGTKIDYTPPENCLIQIVTHNESGNKITVLNKYTSPEWGNCACGNGQGNNLFFEKLLEGGRTYYIYITDTNASPTVRARYVPLLGNV